MRIRTDQVPALERGVALLGSGGGGDTRTGSVLLRGLLAATDGVPVPAVADLPADALVVPLGVVGATAVFTEKLPGGGEFELGVEAIGRWTGQRAAPAALMSIEVGGLNGISALVAGATLGLPVVDADLCGRGLPRLDQFSLVAAGRRVCPCALVEPGGRVVLVDGASPAEVERTARGYLATTGGWAVLVLAPVPAGQLADCAVVGSVGAAVRLGAAVLALPESAGAAAVAAAIGGRVLGQGPVVEVCHASASGPGSASVVDRGGGAVVRLVMGTEYLLALVDGALVGTTPDVLALLDARTLTPIPCDRVRPGDEALVVQVPAPAFWTRPDRLPLVSPRGFGLPQPPVLLSDAGPPAPDTTAPGTTAPDAPVREG